jgi:hypothetical protein
MRFAKVMKINFQTDQSTTDSNPKNNRKTTSLFSPMKSAFKPPALVNVYRRKYPHVTPVVRSVAEAPFGMQRETLLKVIGQQGIDGKFVFPLQKLVFNYCDMGGSSAGIR